MPQFYQKIRNSGRNTGYNSQAKEAVLSSVMNHPLESGFTLIFMHFHQNSEVLSCCIQNKNKVFLQFIPSPDPYLTQQQSIFLSRYDLLAFEYFHSFVEYMDYHLLRFFTLAMHVPPHDKTLENHITFPKESENTTLSTCKHCCLNRECAEYTIYYYRCIETSHRPRFKTKLRWTRQKKTGKQTYTDYVVLAIWAIGGQNFGRPVIKMVANATGRVLILLPVF